MSRSGFGRKEGFNKSGRSIADGILSNVISNVATSLSPEMKYHTGARAVIKINDKLFGFAFAVSWNIQTENQEIMTIDDYMPVELAPRVITINGSLGTFVIPGRSPTSELLQSHILSFMQNKYITIEVSDSASGSILFKTNKAVITSCQTSVQADQVSVTQLTWKAIGWQNEFVPEPPSEASEDRLSSGLKNIGNKVKNFFG